jgi:hypothetical protein
MILGLDTDGGIIKVGSPSEELPGIFESIKTSGSLLFENPEVQGRSGRVKVVQGWDDTAVTITLSLIDNPGAGKTRWDSLKHITGIFKKVGDDGKPEIYTLSHPMITAWGTKKLLFSFLETSENRTRQKISVSINLIEYDSLPGIIQDRQAGSKGQPDPVNVAAAQERMMVSGQQRLGVGKLEERFAKY